MSFSSVRVGIPYEKCLDELGGSTGREGREVMRHCAERRLMRQGSGLFSSERLQE